MKTHASPQNGKSRLKKALLVFVAIIAITSRTHAQWVKKADIPNVTSNSISFSIGTKGYMSNGSLFWEWDQPTNTWAAKAPLLSPLAAKATLLAG